VRVDITATAFEQGGELEWRIEPINPFASDN
jgi:hypothetical protein